MLIKVLGPGCPNCKVLFTSVTKVVNENNIVAEVVKVDDIIEIMNHGIISSPALIVDGKIVAKGRVPSEKEILEILNQAKGI